MKKMSSSTAFLASLLLVIGLAFIASLHFFSEMNSKYILVSNGLHPYEQILDSYKFDRNRRGLIFSVAFLISSTSFLIMVLLPNEEKPRAKRQEPEPAEPKAKAMDTSAESPISGPAPTQAEAGEAVSVEPSSAPSPKADKLSKAAEELENIEELDIEDVDLDAEMDITEGEDDVVYGNGEITAAALIDFVHKYPDSALKFLYRRKLDGKPLSQEEEEIYANWEKRSMTRGKIKRYILQLMNWKEVPKEPLYQIWKQLRDHIFDTFGP